MIKHSLEILASEENSHQYFPPQEGLSVLVGRCSLSHRDAVPPAPYATTISTFMVTTPWLELVLGLSFYFVLSLHQRSQNLGKS